MKAIPNHYNKSYLNHIVDVAESNQPISSARGLPAAGKSCKDDTEVMRNLISALRYIEPKTRKSKQRRTAVISETHETALKAAKAYSGRIGKSYWFWQKSADLCSAEAELRSLTQAYAIAKKLNISPTHLARQPGLLGFIKNNSLHHLVTPEMLALGAGPVMKADGSVHFPVLKDEKLNYVHWKNLPVDAKGKLKLKVTPFGFRAASDKAGGLEPCRAFFVSKEALKIPTNMVAVELVTSHPWYNPIEAGKGSFGHSWIRAMESSEPSSKGEDQLQVVTSAGTCTGKMTVMSPDVREFRGDKTTSVRVLISKDHWEKVQKMIEEIRDASSVDDIEDPEIKAAYIKASEGTCCGFASAIFEYASEDKTKFNGQIPLQRLAGSSLSLAKPLGGEWLANKVRVGQLPTLMIREANNPDSPAIKVNKKVTVTFAALTRGDHRKAIAAGA